MRAFLASAACVLGLLTAACGSDTTTSPSSTTTTATSPVVDTFSSLLAIRGSTARTFAMSGAGTIRVTLSALGNGSSTVGVVVGVPATGAPCSPSVSVVTGPGTSPQIVTAADAGSYCVQVYDPGRLTEDTAFTLTIEHP